MALRHPDAIQAVEVDGKTYIITANEGDDKALEVVTRCHDCDKRAALVQVCLFVCSFRGLRRLR